MKKTVGMGPRPTTQSAATKTPDPDTWVKTRAADGGQKRLTIDIDAALHKRLKSYCAQNDTSIKELLLELIEKKVGGWTPTERRTS